MEKFVHNKDTHIRDLTAYYTHISSLFIPMTANTSFHKTNYRYDNAYLFILFLLNNFCTHERIFYYLKIN